MRGRGRFSKILEKPLYPENGVWAVQFATIPISHKMAFLSFSHFKEIQEENGALGKGVYSLKMNTKN